MIIPARTRRKLKTIAVIGGVGLILGPLFANLAFGFASYRIVKGMIVGWVITSAGAAGESFIFDDKLKRVTFLWAVLIRSLFYFFLITCTTIVVVVIHEGMEHGTTILEVLQGKEFAEFLRGDYVTILMFSAIASFAINFLWQMNRLLGRGVLLNYITGRYHTPRREERVVMFLDLKSSTTIAEGIDQQIYHALLNDYFFDINEPIMDAKGEICQYIGDEVVITWRLKDPASNTNAVRCFFLIHDKIQREKANYERKYGLTPEFKAGIHCGTVIVGEIGDSRKGIVFHGDVMNTASRIQAQCNSLGQSLLVSKELIGNIELARDFRIEAIGGTKLKGKQHEVELYAVRQDSDGEGLP